MTTYTNVFGGQPINPSEISYLQLDFTSNTEYTLYWPASYNTEVPANPELQPFSKLIDCINNNDGGESYSITLPDATESSPGNSFVIRNIGDEDVVILDPTADGNIVVATVATGQSYNVYQYINEESERPVSGSFWRSIFLGTGTTNANATELAGKGLKALAPNTLNRNINTQTLSASYTIAVGDRDTFFVFSGGTETITIPDITAAGFGNGFSFSVLNNGSGILNFVPTGAQTINGQPSFQLLIGESAIFITNGTNGTFTLGYGKDTFFQLSATTINVAGLSGDITVSAADNSAQINNVVGTPSGAVRLLFSPAVWSRYVNDKTVGSNVSVNLTSIPGADFPMTSNNNYIYICDGTDLYSTPTEVTVSSIALNDGSLASPSLYFSSDSSIGLYKTPNTLNFAVNGSSCYIDIDGAFYAEAGLGFSGSTGSGGGLSLPGTYFYANNTTTKTGIVLNISSASPLRTFNWDNAGSFHTANRYRFNDVFSGNVSDFSLSNTAIQIVSGATPTLPAMWFLVTNSVGDTGSLALNAKNQVGIAKTSASASNPNYTWNLDLDTGIYSDADNTFKTTCGGTQTLTFDANGITPASTPIKTATFNQFSPTTTAGDMIARNNLGNDIRIPASTRANEPLLSVLGNIPQWTGYSILDIQTFTLTTNNVFTANAATRTATALTVSLTPKAVNSRVLVYFSCVGLVSAGSGLTIGLNNSSSYISGNFYNLASNPTSTVSGMFLFSPASTSAQTYTVYAGADAATPTVYFNSLNGGVDGAASNYRSTIIAIEIGGF